MPETLQRIMIIQKALTMTTPPKDGTSARQVANPIASGGCPFLMALAVFTRKRSSARNAHSTPLCPPMSPSLQSRGRRWNKTPNDFIRTRLLLTKTPLISSRCGESSLYHCASTVSFSYSCGKASTMTFRMIGKSFIEESRMKSLRATWWRMCLGYASTGTASEATPRAHLKK